LPSSRTVCARDGAVERTGRYLQRVLEDGDRAGPCIGILRSYDNCGNGPVMGIGRFIVSIVFVHEHDKALKADCLKAVVLALDWDDKTDSCQKLAALTGF